MSEQAIAPPSNVVLEARGVSKAFPGVQALDDVGIVVRRGRLNAVLGENGAGKSTLMNILSGVYVPDDGEILLDGRRVEFRAPREAQLAGVSIIHQELNLLPELSVAENIFLGREPTSRLGWIDYRRLNRGAKQLLNRLELDVEPTVRLGRLRVGEQQVVEVAKALSLEARVLIMDEPTSAITEREIEALFRLIAQLKESGVGLVYITHKLDELNQIADDVTVLRDGKLVAAKSFDDVTRDDLVRMMVGRDLKELYPKSIASAGEEVLRLREISLPHPDRPGQQIVDRVSLEVRRGEVVGLFGLMGAGRTELLQSVFGLYPGAASGEVYVDGQRVDIRCPSDAIRAGLALAPEDRKAEGLVLSMGVAENVTLAALRDIVRFGWLSPKRRNALAREFTQRLQLRAASLDQTTQDLSGGNQQKVVLAKWLATRPKALLLDEPTRGIDVGAKREIYALIDELAKSGLAVLMVSSELPEILAMADRILVLSEGRITQEFGRDEATEEAVLHAALPSEIAVP